MKEERKYKVIAISGSTRSNSVNLQLLKVMASLSSKICEVEIYSKIADLPHFNPDLDNENPPQEVKHLRRSIQEADGVIICTPEYVFSLPGALKNAIEWTVSTTVFSEKPVALITASGLGEKAHEALILIMKTLYTKIVLGSTLLISGARSKINSAGEVTDPITLEQIKRVVNSFIDSMKEHSS